MHTRGLGCEGEVTKAGACTIKKIQQSKKALAVFMKCQSSKSLMCEYFINTCWGGRGGGGCTVEPPITDTPRSGQPLYSGQTLCCGLKLL